jgi:PAS domain S-box-containing protein
MNEGEAGVGAPQRLPRPTGAIEQGRPREEERDEIVERAQRQASELEAIFTAHADGLIIFGQDGEIRSMNPAARELFGIGEGPIGEYRELLKALAPADERGEPLDLDEVPSRRAMRGEVVKGSVTAVHTARGLVWYSSSAAPLRAPDGTIAGAVVSCVDITHLHRLQEERERGIRTLTHDARTRLNVIRTHGELLGLAAVNEEEARRRAGIIVSNVRQLADIIDALVHGR